MKKFSNTKEFWSNLDENANKTFSEDIDLILEGIKNLEEIQYVHCAKLFIADAKRKLYFKTKDENYKNEALHLYEHLSKEGSFDFVKKSISELNS